MIAHAFARVYMCDCVCEHNSKIFYLDDNDATNRHMPRYSCPLKAPLVFWWMYPGIQGVRERFGLVCMSAFMYMCTTTCKHLCVCAHACTHICSR